jgi:PAS domain-containing protein
VSILDLAQRLIRESPDRPEIVFTGLRRGEKLHERLLGKGEPDLRPFHPLITHAPVPPLAPALLRGLESMSADDLSAALAVLCDADHDGADTPALGMQAADGYLVIDANGRIIAMSPAAADWLHMTSAQGAGPAAFWLPVDARHADGSPMGADEHPGIATHVCGQDFSGIICSVHWVDDRWAWLECSSRAVTFGKRRSVLVEFRPVHWDPDPDLPEVQVAMARVDVLRRALRDASR